MRIDFGMHPAFPGRRTNTEAGLSKIRREGMLGGYSAVLHRMEGPVTPERRRLGGQPAQIPKKSLA